MMKMEIVDMNFLILLAGTSFIAGVYKIERYFREQEIEKCKNVDEFIKEIEKVISVKIDKNRNDGGKSG